MGYTRKEIERRALEAAHRASAIIPGGKIHDFEQPDFILETDSGVVGIEVTELLPEAGSDSFSNALEEKSFQEEVGAFPFEFDRVFFFAGLDKEVAEIRKGEM